MKDQSSSGVAGSENPCIAGAEKPAEGASADSHGDQRKRIPKETEATEQASPSEPVETRLAADGDSLATQIGRIVWAFDRGDNRQNEVRILASTAAFIEAELDSAKAEVRRLREENAELKANHASLLEHHDMWKQQWEVMRDTMWKPAMAKLARVEALYRLLPTPFCDIIKAALRDDQQPSAAPKSEADELLERLKLKPKQHEPYNGY